MFSPSITSLTVASRIKKLHGRSWTVLIIVRGPPNRQHRQRSIETNGSTLGEREFGDVTWPGEKVHLTFTALGKTMGQLFWHNLSFPFCTPQPPSKAARWLLTDWKAHREKQKPQDCWSSHLALWSPPRAWTGCPQLPKHISGFTGKAIHLARKGRCSISSLLPPPKQSRATVLKGTATCCNNPHILIASPIWTPTENYLGSKPITASTHSLNRKGLLETPSMPV